MSMTGFGKAETEWLDKRINVEVRSLNSKNADINLRTPSYLRELDSEIRKYLAQQLHRGKIDLNVFIEFNGQSAPSTINTTIVKAYMEQLKNIGGTESERLVLAMRLPDILSSDKESLQENEKVFIFELLEKVVGDLNKYRSDEGNELEKEFLLRISLIEKLLIEIVKVDPERGQKIEAKLRSSLDNLKIEIDANRFEQELIFYIEKFDITEEKTRLKNHLDYFKQVMKNDFPNGKKLAFIAQEIGREVNTIGSKANHSDLQKIVVQMKDELEKIKEQLLNVL